jgi:DNA modification methylase
MSKTIKSLGDLTLDKRNANKGTPAGQDMVDQSIADYGAGRSIVVDRNGAVIGGNKTLKSAIDAGLDVEVVTTKGDKLIVHQREDLDLDEDTKARMLAYADNRASELGLVWDTDVIGEDIASGLDLDDMFSDAELKKLGVDLLGDGEPPEAQIDAAELLQEKWQVKTGDVWQIGEHRLMCGDSTNQVDVDNILDSEDPVLLLTDPPYGVSIGETNYNPKQGKVDKLQNDNLRGDAFFDFISDSIRHWLRPRMSIYSWSAALSEGGTMLAALKSIGVHIQGQIVWVKPSLVLGQADYQWRHEQCWYGYIKGSKPSHYWYGGRKETTVWDSSRETYTPHPTQKPVPIMSKSIINSSSKGQVVCDPFLGSGTTMVACENLGRKCYGMEIEPKYCAVILERMSDMGLTPERVDGDK